METLKMTVKFGFWRHTHMKKNIVKHIIIILISVVYILAFLPFGSISQAKTLKYTNEELQTIIETLYNHRNTAFVTGDFSVFKDDFDTSRKNGVWAKEHEIKRVKYLRDWATARGIKFTGVTSTIRIKKVKMITNPMKIALEETCKFDYIYPADAELVTNSFGVGIRHSVSLTKKDEGFIIANDWYTDCFEDALKAYDPEITEKDGKGDLQLLLNCRPRLSDYMPEKGRYDRTKAVQYADKFCGAANGEGNNFKYNKKYSDFNGIGGDCTNFASQVLGDPEAGGLKQDSKWYKGSFAWVNADGFKDYLIYSGKGRQIKKGTFKELVLPKENYPYGAIDKLDLGDLICYAKGKNMDHFAVITGWDSHGYPLVNSHTTDRYHVPWDLGWGDKNIYFHLIHVR